MRHVAILLITASVSSIAAAQPQPLPDMVIAPTPATKPVLVKQLGLDGRKGKANSHTVTAPSMPTAPSGKPPTMAANPADPSLNAKAPPTNTPASAAPAEKSKELSSDKKLGGDASIIRERNAAAEKERAAAEQKAAAKNPPKTPVATPPSNTVSPNSSMTFQGGVRVEQK